MAGAMPAALAQSCPIPGSLSGSVTLAAGTTADTNPMCWVGYNGLQGNCAVTVTGSFDPGSGWPAGLSGTIDPNPTQTFSPWVVHITAAASVPAGTYIAVANGLGPAGKCEIFANGVTVTVTSNQPTISGIQDLWWFGGENPSGWNTSLTLTASPTNAGSYTWTISSGGNDVVFSANNATTITTSTNTVTVKSIGASPGIDQGHALPDNVVISVKANGVTSPNYGFGVRRPYEDDQNKFTMVNVKYPKGEIWESDMFMYPMDQFLQPMPHQLVPSTEHWTSGDIPSSRYPNETWLQPLANGGQPGISDYADLTLDAIDLLNGFRNFNPSPRPTKLQRTPSTKLVDSWTGEWWYGSSTEAHGSRVQSQTWNRFLDHATYSNITSPSP
jgi:hypothetical protein